jgi:hypothetical protein
MGEDCLMDAGGAQHIVVIPSESGVSSTPRLLDSIAGVAGILGRPVKPGDDGRGMRRLRVQ